MRNAKSEMRSPILYLLSSILFILSSLSSYSQAANNGHADDGSLSTLKYPWAGGLNACQYGEIDLNLDGIKDLVIFDRHGNRILPFRYDGVSGLQGYQWTPSDTVLLPSVHDWVMFKDYNNDGKVDLFTYENGGIAVYKNVSTTTVKFQLVTSMIESYYYTGKIGILVTLVDYPAVDDIDGDGDLDILTFSALGAYVEYHQNQSVEKYGVPDSLDFKLADHCWGNFKESTASNLIILNTTCPYKYSFQPNNHCAEPGGAKHTGSTFLMLDVDGNGTKDPLIGDYDFANLKMLINGGTPDTANMVSQDTAFPSYSIPIALFSLPVAAYLDLNHDGKRDLLVSPFDPALNTSENFKSNWFYANNGTDEIPDFTLQEKGLFQHEMIDVGSNAYPVLVDLNGDGLNDLVVGDLGYYDSSYYFQGSLVSVFQSKLALFINTGSTYDPVFNLETDDFGGFSSLHKTGLYPTFGDLDGDGDLDMLLGSSDGSLLFLKNKAGVGKLPDWEEAEGNFAGIDVGEFSSPQLFDLDKDGVLDLIVGEKKGNLNYYHNDGNAQQPVFVLVTDSLGKINTTNTMLSYDGFSTPNFFLDKEGNIALIVGCEEGKLFFYQDIEGNLEGRFTPSNQLSVLLGTEVPTNFGWRTSIGAGTLTSNQNIDLLVGNFSGGIQYISAQTAPRIISSLPPPPIGKQELLRIFPNPANDLVTIAVEQDYVGRILQISDVWGRIVYSAPLSSVLRLSTTDWKDGIYFIHVGGTVGKLIVAH